MCRACHKWQRWLVFFILSLLCTYGVGHFFSSHVNFLCEFLRRGYNFPLCGTILPSPNMGFRKRQFLDRIHFTSLFVFWWWLECNLFFLKHPNQLTWPSSFLNKSCAASSSFSARNTKLAALWFAGKPWDLYFLIRHFLAYREHCLEYLKLSIVEVHFISFLCLLPLVISNMGCISKCYQRGKNTWIRWLWWQKNPIHLKYPHFFSDLIIRSFFCARIIVSVGWS